jgi:hypothetical protein
MGKYEGGEYCLPHLHLLFSIMPAEPTRAKLKRHSSRKDIEDYHFDGGQARELEQKRSRGQLLSL